MGSTKKSSNWMAYFVLVSVMILIASCGVSAAETPISVSGDELTFDGGEIAAVIEGVADAAKSKAAEAKAYANSEEGKAKAKARKEKAKDFADSTGKALKGATHWVADKAGDAASFVEKKTR